MAKCNERFGIIFTTTSALNRTGKLYRTTPLIRYDVGDVVSISDYDCRCGKPGRLLKGIDGRKEDYVVLNNGALIGRLDHVFKDLVNIREAQIYQKTLGKITIRIVPGDRYSMQDEQAVLEEVRSRIGHNMDIELDHVKELERSQNGKLRFVISEISEAKLNCVYE